MPYVERSEEIGRDYPLKVAVQREVHLNDDLTKILSRKVKGIDVRIAETHSRRMSITEATRLRDLLTDALESAAVGVFDEEAD